MGFSFQMEGDQVLNIALTNEAEDVSELQWTLDNSWQPNPVWFQGRMKLEAEFFTSDPAWKVNVEDNFLLEPKPMHRRKKARFLPHFGHFSKMQLLNLANMNLLLHL